MLLLSVYSLIPFFILMLLLCFCLFVDHVNKLIIFVFEAFVYHFKNTIPLNFKLFVGRAYPFFLHYFLTLHILFLPSLLISCPNGTQWLSGCPLFSITAVQHPQTYRLQCVLLFSLLVYIGSPVKRRQNSCFSRIIRTAR